MSKWVQQWPSVWYHNDFPRGEMFHREEDVPEGAVPTPALIGLDTEGNPIPGFKPEPEGFVDFGDSEPTADLPRRNKGGRPRKVRVDE